MTTIKIPASVKRIGAYAFTECSSLPGIEIPKSVVTIEEGAFYDCYSMTNIKVEEGNNNYASYDGVLYDKSLQTLIKCPSGKTEISFPNSVNTIRRSGFRNCILLKKIELPNSISSIGVDAFYECKSLNYIKLPENLSIIDESTFISCSSLQSIILPSSIKEIGALAFYKCESLEAVTCRSLKVPSVGRACFDWISEESTLYVENSVIEDYKNSDWNTYFSKILPIDNSGVNTISNDNFITFKVYDLSGKKLLETTNKEKINNLPSGIYIINGEKIKIP